jgi:hypothetical protein
MLAADGGTIEGEPLDDASRAARVESTDRRVSVEYTVTRRSSAILLVAVCPSGPW